MACEDLCPNEWWSGGRRDGGDGGETQGCERGGSLLQGGTYTMLSVDFSLETCWPGLAWTFRECMRTLLGIKKSNNQLWWWLLQGGSSLMAADISGSLAVVDLMG